MCFIQHFQRNNHDLCAQITHTHSGMSRKLYAKNEVQQNLNRRRRTRTKVPFRLTSSANVGYNPYAHIADLHRNLRMLYGDDDDDDCKDDDSSKSENESIHESTPSITNEIRRRK